MTKTERRLAQIRATAMQAAIDAAHRRAMQQLDTCCQNRISAYGHSNGSVTEIGVRNCPRHPGYRFVTIRPEPFIP